MRLLLRLVPAALLSWVVLAACTPTQTPPTDDGTPSSTVIATRAAEIPARPDSAASTTDDFRPDSALHVANTGKPQMVEVFSYD